MLPCPKESRYHGLPLYSIQTNPENRVYFEPVGHFMFTNVHCIATVLISEACLKIIPIHILLVKEHLNITMS